MIRYEFVFRGVDPGIARSFPTALMSLVLVTGMALAGGAASKDIEVVGVHVQKQVGEGFPHTGITLIVKQPGKRIVSVDFGASSITAFSDDKNTDLKKEQENEEMFLDSATLFKDGRIALDVRSKFLPAAGATKLKVKCALALRIGSDEKVVEEKNFKLKGGATVTVGPVELSSAVYRDDQICIDVKYTNNALKSIQFLYKDGKVLPTKRVGHGGFGVRFHETFELQREVDAVMVRVTYFSKTQTVMVPLDLSVGLGL